MSSNHEMPFGGGMINQALRRRPANLNLRGDARTGVFNTCHDIDRRASSTAGAKMPSRSWMRKR